MAFRLPNFNLLCNIWNAPKVPSEAPDFSDVPCQLYFTGKPNIPVTDDDGVIPTMAMFCRLPAGTDVRYNIGGTEPRDFIECPADSGRIYGVSQVDDAHKGFANEYRFAVLIPHSMPFPLP